MTLPIFPVLPGQGWSVVKTPQNSTKIAQHVSGREVRVRNWAQTLYQFELTFNGLDSGGWNAGLQSFSLQTLMAFYLSCSGSFAPFLYIDPTDYFCGNAAFGTGDGSTTVFTLQRPVSTFLETAPYVISLANVTSNGGLLDPSSYALSAPNTLTLSAAPAIGAALAASFQYAFPCRFLEDTMDFENFMQDLWSVKSVKFRSVR